jgi:hypothetical protein
VYCTEKNRLVHSGTLWHAKVGCNCEINLVQNEPVMPRILAIDDEEDIRSIVKDHLVKANYEVIEAKDGG